MLVFAWFVSFGVVNKDPLSAKAINGNNWSDMCSSTVDSVSNVFFSSFAASKPTFSAGFPRDLSRHPRKRVSSVLAGFVNHCVNIFYLAVCVERVAGC